MTLEIDARTEAGTARVVLRGDADMATAPALRQALDELVDAGAREIVLDCQELEFLDSSGIGVLVATRALLGDDGALVLEAPRSNVRKVLEVTGVDRELSIRP